MIRGLYTSTAGLTARLARMAVISNNLANATTVGFKQDLIDEQEFWRLLLDRLGPDQARVGALATANVPGEPLIDLTPGPLEATEQPLDLALEGPGFFVVETPDGERLTRAGNFSLDGERRLVAADGALVLGQDGPITLPPGDVTIAPDGTISVDGTAVGQLRIVELPAGANLEKEGATRFAVVGGAPAPAAQTQVRQGFLEGANVDLAGQMVAMLALLRGYQAGQRLLQLQDDVLGKAVNEIGRPV